MAVTAQSQRGLRRLHRAECRGERTETEFGFVARCHRLHRGVVGRMRVQRGHAVFVVMLLTMPMSARWRVAMVVLQRVVEPVRDDGAEFHGPDRMRP